MKWRQQRRHFFEATRQHKPPIEGDYYEWDYSRYSRALGMTAQPGLKEQPHSCWAIAADDPRRWDRVRARYADWARRVGWDVLTLHARPSVVVPDPVVYQLGCEVCPDPELIFFMSGRGGEPAIGKRPRPPGCSIPISSGERWLMATNRVRRRIRNEIASRGLVLFIEEAEFVTAATLHLLTYLSNAHRAWRARMLARDARIYIVLATPPENETLLRRALDRLNIRGPIPAVGGASQQSITTSSLREALTSTSEGTLIRNSTSSSLADNPKHHAKVHAPSAVSIPSRLTVEEEHILLCLQFCEMGLPLAAIRRLFGATSEATVANLATKGVLRRSAVWSRVCISLAPACAHPNATPEGRVVTALLAELRSLGNRYHRRLSIGPQCALLLCKTGHLRKAAAALARTMPATFAATSLSVASRLNALFNREAVRSRPSVALLSLNAHFGEYARALRSAVLGRVEAARSKRRFARLLECAVSMGRCHAGQVMPDEFWPEFPLASFDPNFTEACALLASMFIRIGARSLEELKCAYQAGVSLLQESDLVQQPEHAHSKTERTMLHLARMLAYRVKAHIRIHDPSWRSAGHQECLSEKHVLHHVTPACLLGVVGYVESLARNPVGENIVCAGMHLTFIGATGFPADQRLQVLAAWGKLRAKAIAMDASLFEERVLLETLVFNAHSHRVAASKLSLLAPPKAEVARAATVLLAEPQTRGAAWRSRARLAAAFSLMRVKVGDLEAGVGAAEMALGWESRAPDDTALTVLAHLISCRKALRWEELAIVPSLIRERAGALTPPYIEYLEHMAKGGWAVCKADFSTAANYFEVALSKLGPVRHDGARNLRAWARNELRAARRLEGGSALASSERRVHQNELWRQWLQTVAENVERHGADLDRAFAVLTSLLERAALPDSLFARIYTRLVSQAATATGQSRREVIERVQRHCSRCTQRMGHIAAQAWSAHPVQQLSLNQHALAVRLLEPLGPAGWHNPTIGKSARSDSATVLVTASRHAMARELGYSEFADAGVHTLARRVVQQTPVRGVARIVTIDATVFSEYVTGQLDLEWNGQDGFGQGRLILQHSPALSENTGEAMLPNDSSNPKRGRASGVTAASEGLFIGKSAAAEEVRSQIAIAAGCRQSVLITGETGTGKELVARGIHESNPNSRKLVIVDCACLVPSVAASELFGHAKGAFTGAHVSRSGFVAEAHGGTLFLDEVDSLPSQLQAALLRVLETGEYRAVGSSTPARSEFRLVAAASNNIYAQLDTGEFRSDLYYRIAGLKIRIAPLRERRDDLEMLCRHFLGPNSMKLSRDALALLEEHYWPGNVRELRNVISAAKILSVSGKLSRQAIAKIIAAEDHGALNSGSQGFSATTRAGWIKALSSQSLHGRAVGIEEVRSITGWSRRTAQRRLAFLVRAGKARMVGAGRGTRYELDRTLLDEHTADP